MMKYFKDDDFKCSCGCNFDVTDEVKELSDKLREVCGIPLIVNSGARCKAHNEAIGASDTSSHIDGLAVDFKCDISNNRYIILSSAIKLGIQRIGLHKKFIHIDIARDRADEVVWFY